MQQVIERRYSPSARATIEVPIIHSKYMCFEKEIEYTGKTERWVCCNNKSDEPLGLIHWYGAWRQYVFEPEDGAIIFNDGCLKIIVEVLEMLNRKQRSK